MFAVITPALITGAFAERMKFKTYLAFLVLWSLLIYSPVCHWVWGVGGFLRVKGLLDFAGGTVVHMTAGFSALAAALAFGPRKDYGKPEIASHNVPFICLGTGLLWFGWFGFNGGSALSANDVGSNALVVTHISAAVATLVWLVGDWIFKGKPTLTGACIGAVVGLIAITPASGFVGASSALLIGLIAGAASYVVALIRGKTQIDDSLDVFAAHGIAGLTGVLLTGLFASKSINAAGVDGSGAQFAIQLQGAAIVAIYSFVVTFILCKVLNVVFGLRPSASEEAAGQDATDHGERAYIS
jgi:Amt family ammonium transporter